MPATNHSTRMEKHQIAISSSSEKDIGTLLTYTPYNESPIHRDSNRHTSSESLALEGVDS